MFGYIRYFMKEIMKYFIPMELLSSSDVITFDDFIFVKCFIYDLTIGYFYTQHMMKNVLKYLPSNSKILDIGIGTCYTYFKNIDILERKNIRVVGVDIDEAYSTYAKYYINKYKLDERISIINKDIYEVKENYDVMKDFNIILFSDSYAVIPNVFDMIEYSRRFLCDKGTIVIVSTLFDNYNYIIDMIKRNMIYVTFVDYGKMMIKSDIIDYYDDYSINIQPVNITFTEINRKNIPLINYQLKTYIVDIKYNDLNA
jgi:hypothetical protein